VPGLVSIADVAPTVRSLERGEKPILTSRPARDAPAQLEQMNARLNAAHFARKLSTRVLIGLVFGFAVLAWLLRSPFFGRAGLLAIPAMVLASTIASALHVEHGVAWWSGVIALALTLPLAFATRTIPRARARPGRSARRLRRLPRRLAGDRLARGARPAPRRRRAFLRAHKPGRDAAARPDARARGARRDCRCSRVVALASLVVVGWSRLGAGRGRPDRLRGGFATLALLGLRGRVTVARVALAGRRGDRGRPRAGRNRRPTGGSSHVTHAVGGGPDRVLSDLGHRLRLSWRGIVNKTDHLEIAVVSLVTLVVLAVLRPRSRTLDALLVALAVSLVVNDSGFDILRFGALVAIAVFTWSRTMCLRD
jgi:hypothetical protein